MQINHADICFEEHYRNIIPRIIGEEYLENLDGDVRDYKVFCFHGEPRYIMYLCDRKKGLKMAFFDLEWHRMPFVYTYPECDDYIPKPDNLDKILLLTKTLCVGFKHVRVDWYILNDGSIKFREISLATW